MGVEIVKRHFSQSYVEAKHSQTLRFPMVILVKYCWGFFIIFFFLFSPFNFFSKFTFFQRNTKLILYDIGQTQIQCSGNG